MMRPLSFVTLLSILGFIAGCGGESQSDGTGGGAGSGGNGASAGSGGNGAGGASGGSGGSGAEGGSASCEDYRDAPPAQGTTVVLRNQTSQTLFVSTENSCGIVPPFTLADATGKEIPLGTDTCGSSCQELQEHEQLGCPAVCLMPPVLRIEPNGSHSYAWPRAVLEGATMPKSCYFAPESAPATCQRLVEVAAGSYKLTAKAGTVCDECKCTPDANGSCEAPGGQVSGSTVSAESTATLPTGAIEVVFK